MMKKIRISIVFVLLCLLSACGQNTPTLVLERESEVLSIPGQADMVTHYDLFGGVDYTQEICPEDAPEGTIIWLDGDSERVQLNFSCEFTDLRIQVAPNLLGADTEIIENVTTLELKRDCSYYIEGTFVDGQYEYHMTFGQIIVWHSEESGDTYGEMSRAFRHQDNLYQPTGITELAELPEGYVFSGSIAQNGTEYLGNFSGEAFWSEENQDFYVKAEGSDGYQHFTLNPAESVVGYWHYFRNNTWMPGVNGLAGDYGDFPWEQEVDLTELLSDLTNRGWLPEIADAEMTARGLYHEDNSLYGLEVTWRRKNPEDAYNDSRITLRMYPEAPEDLGWARAYVMDRDSSAVTETKVSGGVVYGLGTDISAMHVIDYVRADGALVQLQAAYGITLEELGTLLDRFTQDESPLKSLLREAEYVMNPDNEANME